MPLEDILKKIKDAAAAQCSAIVGEATEKAEAKVAQVSEEAARAAAKRLDEALAVIKRDAAIAVARADTERRQAILQEKQHLVSSVFETALQELSSMPDGEYRDFLVQSMVGTMTGGEEVVLGPRDEARLGPDFLEALKSGLKASGKPEEVSLSYSDSVRGGGFILKKGGLAFNLTFPAVTQKLMDELEIEVARCLFGEQPGS